MQSDSDLLQLFSDHGDEPAFTRLVERHAGMVRAVIRRRTQDEGLVEEAVWKVFAVLARKARSLRTRPLAGWLHRAAMHEAANASRKTMRYQRTLREFSNETMNTPRAESSSWEEIQPHLDTALSRLPSDARELVLMHCLEQRGIAEIASATGTNAEACRKRIRRSLDLLETILRKRGLSVTGTGLLTMLAANSPGIGHAAAVSVAAAALQAAPTLSTSSIGLYSLHLMNHTTSVKIVAVAVVLAAIPITILWRQNAELQETVREMQSHAGTPEIPERSKGAKAMTTADASPQASKIPDTSTNAHAVPAPAPVPPVTAMEAMIRKGHAKAKKEAGLEYTRICLNLPDLSEDQKTSIREALEKKYGEAFMTVLEVFESGAVAKAAQAPESLSPEEKAAIAQLDPRRMDPPVVNGELQSILTAAQFETYAAKKEQKRVGDAEDRATDQLKSLGRKFDLSPEQKDNIFQQLATHELDAHGPGSVKAGDPFPQIGSRDDARDNIIRAHLTPQQSEIFDRDRAVEKEALQAQMMEFYKERAAIEKTNSNNP